MSNILWVDFETSNSDPALCLPLSMAWKLTDNLGNDIYCLNNRGHVFLKFANQYECSPEAFNIHKIDEFDFCAGHNVSAVREMLPELPYNTILAGHNVAQFDARIIKRYFPDYYKQLGYRVLDTHSMGMAVFGKSMSFDELLQHLGLKRKSDRHSALEDVELAIEAYRRMQEYIKEEVIYLGGTYYAGNMES